MVDGETEETEEGRTSNLELHTHHLTHHLSAEEKLMKASIGE